MKALQLWFAALAQRERRWVLACLAIVLVALLWWVAIAPALATLKSAAQAHRQLDEQLQTMQSLASQAAQPSPRAQRYRFWTATQGRAPTLCACYD